MVGSTWHICLPGPSFKWEDVEPKESDTVVAVNSCLGPIVDGGGEADYWVCVDDPHPVHFLVQEQALKTQPVLVTHHALEKWEEFGMDDVRGFPWPEKHWVRTASHKHLSVCHAIYWASFWGAESIKLWGCDMAGTDYVNTPCLDTTYTIRIQTRKVEGKTEEVKLRCVADALETQRERRWVQERATITRLIEAAETNGITLERMVKISG